MTGAATVVEALNPVAPTTHDAEKGEAALDKSQSAPSSDDVGSIKNGNEFRDDPLPATIDRAAEKRLVRKMDLWLVPTTFLVYTFWCARPCAIFLADSTASSTARRLAMPASRADNGLVGSQYNLGVSVFFIAYSVFQPISNLALKRVGAKYWLTFLIVSFGAITIGTAWSRNFGTFIAVRFLLGMVEGGVLSGMAFMLTKYYTRTELVPRIGIFMTCATSSGAFGGLLAYGLIQIGPKGNLKSWSWIFLVEGIISIACGVLAFVVFAKDIESTWWLSADDKVLARERMRESNRTHENVDQERTTSRLVLSALTNPFFLGIGFCYMADSFIVQSLAIFTPTILQGFGYSTVQSQLHSVYPNILGTATTFAFLAAAYKTKKHGPWIFCCFIISMTGFGMLLSKNHDVQYAGVFLASIGAFAPGCILIAWAGSNAAPVTVRAIATAMAPAIGHIGAIASAWSYRTQDAPRYVLGNALNLGACAWGAFLAVCLMLYVIFENKARATGKRDHRLTDGDELANEKLGSRSPRYKLLL